jgi:hypothetical protein
MSAIVSLDGSVQRQGIKVSARDWLDMGSETWAKTPDKVKALAYQAAQITGWTDAGLIKLMTGTWGPRIDEDTAKFTLETLRELSKENPADVEEVYKDDAPPPVFKITGCDKMIPFPPKD